MDLTLTREQYTECGIFGTLRTADGQEVAKTLEHAYPAPGPGWLPKVPPGAFVCVLGPHSLPSSQGPFQTYEVTGVPGHTGILFHIGNWQADSHGCILLGTFVTESEAGKMLAKSAAAFTQFMALQAGAPTFTLTVAA